MMCCLERLQCNTENHSCYEGLKAADLNADLEVMLVRTQALYGSLSPV